MSQLSIALLVIVVMCVCYIGAAFYWKSPTLTNKEWWITVVGTVAVNTVFGPAYMLDRISIKEYMLIAALELLCLYFCCFCPRFFLHRENAAMQKSAVKYALFVAGCAAVLVTCSFFF